MSAEKRWRIVCYDVRDPRRYRALHKVMKGVGHRLQYSVFRARLDDREVEQLRWTLAKILDPVDRLLVVDLCPSCASRAISRNHVEEWTEKPPAHVIVGKQAPGGVEASHASAAEKPTDSKGLPAPDGGEELERTRGE